MKHQCTLTKNNNNNNKKKKKKLNCIYTSLFYLKINFVKSKIIFREKFVNLKKCILYIYIYMR